MTKQLNCLIVDDHPMVTDAYISILSSFTENYKFNFLKAIDCKSGYKIIEQNFKLNNKIDVAIFDVSLPAFKEKNISCGGDLALHFKTRFNDSKIIMITHHHEGMIIDKIIKKVDPEGFINKSDVGFETFSKIFKVILRGEKFISKTIKNSIKELNNKKFGFDNIDYEIISLINEGIKTKDLPNYIPITLSAIEKRKTKIKSQVLNDKGNDSEMIEKIKELNLI